MHWQSQWHPADDWWVLTHPTVNVMDHGSRTWTSGARPRSNRSAGRWWAFVASSFLAAGCAGRGNAEVLEANLRQHEDRILAYERQVASLREELVAARTESDQLRRELVALGKDGRQEATEPLSRVAGIQFNSMMTGGRDSDGSPGHDVITAVVAPHDKDGDLVKLGGELQLEVLDLTRSPEQQRLGTWKYTAEQARELWHSGFLASGFQVDLPIDSVPKSGEVILHARLVTTDGRQFDTTRPVTLASAEAIEPPRGLPAPPRQPRPVTALPAAHPTKRAPSQVVMASAEIPEPPAAVEASGIARLDDAAEAAPAKRPVPEPRDLPVVRPGTSPRPFPGTPAAEQNSGPRPFPVNPGGLGRADVTTSDRWSDESIPYLR